MTLSARRLITTTKDLPMDWAAQRRWLGFPVTGCLGCINFENFCDLNDQSGE